MTPQPSRNIWAQWADKLDLEATAVIEDADAAAAYSRIAGVKPKAQGTTS
jgi:hypothetical protein